jgi:D-arabinose 1-dehydrogenase-like Zn-dependent alcohol dehydrogenase
MAEQLTHSTYKFVSEQEAEGIAWVFVDKENMQRVHIKFPELKPTEARAKVTYTGLCHSDCHTVRDEWGPVTHPICPGHEIVGVVTHVGADVTNLKIGDRVGFGAQRDCCDECEFCKLTFDQICTSDKVDQKFTYGDKYWGGYASHVQHPAKFFFKLPEGLPEERIPPLFCAGATTYAPVAKYAKPGQEVAVLGIGGLGHLAVQYAKAWGCNVTAFTSNKSKEQFIKGLGADRVVVSDDETLKQEAGKYHLVLNTLPEADKLNEYVSLTRPMGTFCQLGLPDTAKPSKFNPGLLIFGQINFVGSLIGSRKELRETLDFSAKHNIVPLCEEFDFEDFPKAYDRLLNGRPFFRCVVNATKVTLKQ